MTKKVRLILFAAFCAATWALSLWATPDGTSPYPAGYRKWAHVSSALVGPQSPAFKRYGGLHHIYANDKAIEGYNTGHFPDGSVIVFDLLDTKEVNGTTIEGPRKFIDVMTKNSQMYKETGGWGFEEFNGDSQTDRALNEEAKVTCYKCHASQKDHDFVFSRLRK